MPSVPVRLASSARALGAGLERIRRRLEVPMRFPTGADAEARAAAAREARRAPGPQRGERDRRDLSLLTIDPPGSRDLDQAVAIERRGGGHRVWYAIADVPTFVAPGGALDAETRRRGVTVYMPDARAGLHPAAIAEGAASLLPGRERPALTWCIDLDPAGEPTEWTLERCRVRSRRRLSYGEAQAEIDRGGGDPTLALLREVGLARRERARARGALSLELPSQEVVRSKGSYALRYEAPLPVEAWNAQISLLTGICAARTMADAGRGLFRVLPPSDPDELVGLRAAAHTLGVSWPAAVSYAEFLRGLDPSRPAEAALLARAARLLRGAGYAEWSATSGQAPPSHAAVASVYAHVTAPLRRLADRFALELVLAQCHDRDPPGWVDAGLAELPGLMDSARRRAGAVERAVLDYLEAVVLAPRVGERFRAAVLRAGGGRATVQLEDPAVVTRIVDDRARAGEEIELRLVGVDPEEGRVDLARV